MTKPTTSSAIWEMNITLDDVSCCLHITIYGKLVNDMAKIYQKQGYALITELFGANEDDVTNECKNMKGAHIEFAWLKQ